MQTSGSAPGTQPELPRSLVGGAAGRARTQRVEHRRALGPRLRVKAAAGHEAEA